jgi:hydroxymethylglutaryl-CoA synthase
VTRIAAAGAYAPRFRLPADAVADAWGAAPSGIESTAVPFADEDALTMAVAAARRALAAGDVDPADVEHLALATTTPPLEESDLTARLGAMLGVPDDAGRQSFGASTRAGTRALTAALDAAPDPGLVVAADCPRGEPHDERDHAAGAGAAAFLLAAEGPAAVADRAEHATPAPGTRFRRAGSDRVEGLGVTAYDRARFREAVAGAVDGLAAPVDVDAAAVQAPDGGLPYRVTDALGVDADAVAAHETVSELGDTAAASAPLSLVRALAAGEDALAVAFGSGAGADALLVETDGRVPARVDLGGEESVDYARALRLRGEVTADAPDGGGAYVSVPAWRRSLPGRYRPAAGRCPDCGALAFPPRGACGDCGSLAGFETVELPGTGTVETVTRIDEAGAPPEFVPQASRGGPFGVALVALDGPGGGSVSAPLQLTDGRAAAAGDRVRAVVRRAYVQQGLPRYGAKALPAGD